jgi:hypothetical protein
MPASDRLFTPRLFVMCGFAFTAFLAGFMLFPTAPFHILDLGGTIWGFLPMPRLSRRRLPARLRTDSENGVSC